MGMFDFLFKAKPGNVTQTTKTTLGPEQQSFFSSFMPQINQASKPITPWGGDTVAGFNPNQIAGQDQVVGAAQGGVMDLANAGVNAQKYFLDPARLDVTNDPNVARMAAAIRDQTTQHLGRDVLPMTRQSNIQGGGMYSGGNSRAGIAEGEAIAGTEGGMAATLAKLFMDAFGGAANRQMQAQGMNAQVMNNAAAPGVMQDAVGQAQQAQQQRELDAQIQAHYLPQTLPAQQAAMLLQLLQGMPGGSTTSNSTGTNPQAPLFSQLLGAAATAIGGMNNRASTAASGGGGP